MSAADITVHPTAVVSPEVTLAPDVVIGAYAVVETGAVLGPGCRVDAHAVIKGSVTLGDRVTVHSGAVLGDDPQDLSFNRGMLTRVEIGSDTTLREGVTVHRSTHPERVTRVGRDCLLMAGSHVAHDAQVGDGAVLCNGALVAGHVDVGARAFLSGNTVVHQFCRVGELVMLSGLSGVGRDVGPYLTVAGRSDVVGVNTVGMRRSGLDGAARLRVKEAYRVLFGAASLAAGLDRVREMGGGAPEIDRILSFYGQSRRGFSRPPASHAFGVERELDSI